MLVLTMIHVLKIKLETLSITIVLIVQVDSRRGEMNKIIEYLSNRKHFYY